MDVNKIQSNKLNSRYFDSVKCDLCGFDKYKIIYSSRYSGKTIEELKKMYRASGDDLLIDQLVKCKKCGLIYVNPRIKSEMIIKGYSEGSDETFVSQAKSREDTFRKSLSLIEKFYPKKGYLLDVGTAGGSFLAAAKKKGWKIYGCEPNNWLAEWGSKNYNIKIDKVTIFDQNYTSNHFDVVTLWDVIEHTPSPS